MTTRRRSSYSCASGTGAKDWARYRLEWPGGCSKDRHVRFAMTIGRRSPQTSAATQARSTRNAPVTGSTSASAFRILQAQPGFDGLRAGRYHSRGRGNCAHRALQWSQPSERRPFEGRPLAGCEGPIGPALAAPPPYAVYELVHHDVLSERFLVIPWIVPDGEDRSDRPTRHTATGTSSSGGSGGCGTVGSPPSKRAISAAPTGTSTQAASPVLLVRLGCAHPESTADADR